MDVGNKGKMSPVIRIVVKGMLWLVLLCCGPIVAAEAGSDGESNGGSDAGAAAGAPEPATPTSRLIISTGLGTRDLVQRYPDLVVWLDAGDGDTELALFEAERSSPAEGAVLVLGGEGQSPAAALPGSMRSLLTDHGWAVMALGLPQSPLVEDAGKNSPPSAAGDSANAADGGGAAPTADESVMIDVMAEPDASVRNQDYHDRLQNLLAAASDELGSRGYQRIVFVGVGRAALPVMQAAMGGAGEPRELVWVTPQFTATGRDAWPASLEGMEQWPILDLVNVLVAPKPARDRAAVFRRQGVAGYEQQQVPLAEPVSGQDAPVVVNRILAWLAKGGTSPDSTGP